MKTIKDIAKEAKVSPGTVDRVLHNRGGVSYKTEALIKKILKKNNFKINKVARSLALNKTINIATLLPKFDNENIFWQAPELGIRSGCEEFEIFGVRIQGFPFDQFNAAHYLSQFKALLNSKPDGVIIAPNFLEETSIMTRLLEENKIPYIFINIDLEGFDTLTFIGQDALMSGRLAGKLMQLCVGNEGAVLIIEPRGGSDANKTISKRISGFKVYLEEHSPSVKQLYLDASFLREENDFKLRLEMALNKNPNIKGLFVPNSRTAHYVGNLDELTLKKLGIIGFDGTEENVNSLKAGNITFLISQKPFRQGYDAVKTLANYLIDGTVPEAKMYSPIEILSKENVDFSREVKHPGKSKSL